MAPRSRKLSGVGRGVAALPRRGAGDTLEGVVTVRGVAAMPVRVAGDTLEGVVAEKFLAESDDKENEEVIVPNTSEDVMKSAVKKVARVNRGRVNRLRTSSTGGSGVKTMASRSRLGLVKRRSSSTSAATERSRSKLRLVKKRSSSSSATPEGSGVKTAPSRSRLGSVKRRNSSSSAASKTVKTKKKSATDKNGKSDNKVVGVKVKDYNAKLALNIDGDNVEKVVKKSRTVAKSVAVPTSEDDDKVAPKSDDDNVVMVVNNSRTVSKPVSVNTSDSPVPLLQDGLCSPSQPTVHTSSSAVPNGSPGSSQLPLPGCHMSSAGGVHKAVLSAVRVRAKSFALFLRPQRTWAAPPLDPEVAEKFRELCREHSFPAHLILPHGSYLVNLGSPKVELREKSVMLLVEELMRCHSLGLTMFNIHPGSSCGEISRERCIRYIAEGINRAHRETAGSGVKVVLENMSCQGHTIGGDLRELRQIMELVEDKARLGVCLDTCHAMAAGFDLSTQAGFDRLCQEFDEQVGWEWLVGAHLNDSQGPAGCHRDRHANIGKGQIGEEGFRRILNSPHFADIPLILETPPIEGDQEGGYRRELELLEGMVEKDGLRKD